MVIEANNEEEDSDDELIDTQESGDSDNNLDIYNDFCAIGIANLQQYNDSKVLQVVEEELGHDNMQIVSYGVQFIIINDYMGNFMPVFGLSVSQLYYEFGMTLSKKQGNTKMQLSSSYFNATEGYWEPIVELFDVELVYQQER